MNWKCLKANAKTAIREMGDDYGLQHLWRSLLGVLVIALTTALLWLLFHANKWSQMGLTLDWIVCAVIAFLIVFIAIFVYKLISVSIRGQIKAEQERDEAKQALAAAKEIPQDIKPPQGRITRRVRMAQKLLSEKAQEAKSVDSYSDMCGWMHGAAALVRGLCIPQISAKFPAVDPRGVAMLTPADKQNLERAAAMLNVIASQLKEEHLKG
jgi:uncharacterized membrane protein